MSELDEDLTSRLEEFLDRVEHEHAEADLTDNYLTAAYLASENAERAKSLSKGKLRPDINFGLGCL